MTSNPEQPPVVEHIDDDADLAPVTAIPTAFNLGAETESADLGTVEDTVDTEQSRFMKWTVEKNEMIQERVLNVLRGLGKAGMMLVDTWNNPDLSVEKKVGGTLVAGVAAAGELVKGSILMGAAANLISMIPGEKASRGVDSFVGGAVDSATKLLVKTNPDGSSEFNEEAIANFTNKKGLIGVGIGAVAAGVGAVMDTESTRKAA